MRCEGSEGEGWGVRCVGGWGVRCGVEAAE